MWTTYWPIGNNMWRSQACPTNPNITTFPTTYQRFLAGVHIHRVLCRSCLGQPVYAAGRTQCSDPWHSLEWQWWWVCRERPVWSFIWPWICVPSPQHKIKDLKCYSLSLCFLLVNIPQILTWDPRLALAAVTNAKFDKCFCLCGLLRRSFCGVNKGTHARPPWDPLGNTSYSYVREGNQLCARTLGFKVSDQKIKQGTWYVCSYHLLHWKMGR